MVPPSRFELEIPDPKSDVISISPRGHIKFSEFLERELVRPPNSLSVGRGLFLFALYILLYHFYFDFSIIFKKKFKYVLYLIGNYYDYHSISQID